MCTLRLLVIPSSSLAGHIVASCAVRMSGTLAVRALWAKFSVVIGRKQRQLVGIQESLLRSCLAFRNW